MKRLQVHVRVSGLDRSVAFDTTLLGAAPDVLKPDYAKWMLDDPRVNFAISANAAEAGIDHLGIQVDDGQVAEITGRLAEAGTEAERRDAFEAAFRALTRRIEQFVAMPVAASDPASLKRRLDGIGAEGPSR